MRYVLRKGVIADLLADPPDKTAKLMAERPGYGAQALGHEQAFEDRPKPKRGFKHGDEIWHLPEQHGFVWPGHGAGRDEYPRLISGQMPGGAEWHVGHQGASGLKHDVGGSLLPEGEEIPGHGGWRGTFFHLPEADYHHPVIHAYAENLTKMHDLATSGRLHGDALAVHAALGATLFAQLTAANETGGVEGNFPKIYRFAAAHEIGSPKMVNRPATDEERVAAGRPEKKTTLVESWPDHVPAHAIENYGTLKERLGPGGEWTVGRYGQSMARFVAASSAVMKDPERARRWMTSYGSGSEFAAVAARAEDKGGVKGLGYIKGHFLASLLGIPHSACLDDQTIQHMTGLHGKAADALGQTVEGKRKLYDHFLTGIKGGNAYKAMRRYPEPVRLAAAQAAMFFVHRMHRGGRASYPSGHPPYWEHVAKVAPEAKLAVTKDFAGLPEDTATVDRMMDRRSSQKGLVRTSKSAAAARLADRMAHDYATKGPTPALLRWMPFMVELGTHGMGEDEIEASLPAAVWRKSATKSISKSELLYARRERPELWGKLWQAVRSGDLRVEDDVPRFTVSKCR